MWHYSICTVLSHLIIKCRIVSDMRGEERGLMGMIIIVRYKENTVYYIIIPPEIFLNKESPMIYYKSI